MTEQLLVLNEHDNYLTLVTLITTSNLVKLCNEEVTGINNIEVLEIIGKSNISKKTLAATERMLKNRDYTLFPSCFGDYIKCDSIITYTNTLADHIPRGVRILKIAIGIPTNKVPQLLKYLQEHEELRFMYQQLQTRLSNL